MSLTLISRNFTRRHYLKRKLNRTHLMLARHGYGYGIVTIAFVVAAFAALIAFAIHVVSLY